MGGALGGGFSSSGGTFHGNLNNLARLNNVNLSSGEQFGYLGSGRNVRVIEAVDPESAAKDFFEKMRTGGQVTTLGSMNSEIKGFRVDFKDGSTVVLRLKSKSGGPAISLNDKKNINFKIHFETISNGRK